MGGSSLQLARHRLIRRIVIELVLMYAALAAAWFVGGAFLRLDAFGVAVTVVGLYLIVRIGSRQPSPLMACPFCRRAWAGDPGRDRRVTCAGCQMRCRPYLLLRVKRSSGFFGVIDAGTQREIGSSLPSPVASAQDHARRWADRPGLFLLGYVVLSLLGLFLIGALGGGDAVFWMALIAWVLSLAAALPVAIGLSKRRYERLKGSLGTSCGKCRYDLSSLVAAKPEGLIRCPECGLETDPRAPADPAVAARDARADRVTSR